MGEKVDGWLITANVRTTVYSLVVARTGGAGRLSLLGCHLRTSAKHRSFAAYRVRAWPGADARWQAPPQAKLARSRGRGPRHSVVQFGAKREDMWRRLAGRAHLGQSLEIVAYRARNWKFESSSLQRRVTRNFRRDCIFVRIHGRSDFLERGDLLDRDGDSIGADPGDRHDVLRD